VGWKEYIEQQSLNLVTLSNILHSYLHGS